jgi:hypothetical protein
LCPVPKSNWKRHKCEPNNIATKIRCNAPQQTRTYELEEPATPFLSHSSIMKTGAAEATNTNKMPNHRRPTLQYLPPRKLQHESIKLTHTNLTNSKWVWW